MKVLLNLTGTMENTGDLSATLQDIKKALKEQFNLDITLSYSTQEWEDFYNALPSYDIDFLGSICSDWIINNLYDEHPARIKDGIKFSEIVLGKTNPQDIALSLKIEFNTYMDLCFIEKMLDEVLGGVLED